MNSSFESIKQGLNEAIEYERGKLTDVKVMAYQSEDRCAIFMESLNEFTPDFFEDGRPEQGMLEERALLN